MKGHIGTLALEENGDFQLISGRLLVNVEFDVEKDIIYDGKTLMVIKDFKFVATPLTQIFFNFKNLFNGREDLAEAVHKFARENWKTITELIQDPIWDAFLKGIFKNINKYLETSPLEDTLINS
ncbi:uncharacterized protein LOC123658681 [Melitaea cinxia]|uniref:uncharacterized protein LOC123658681 n=1 Tax=Melitaea cinxia TaxID=113334 RepID=UPI001E274B75|nr:uncharacterized protein LOC123658681 [Melitaea cinxia]